MERGSDFDQRAIAKFWNKTNMLGSCWLWNGPFHESGYGLLLVDHTSMLAHRFSYALTNGPFEPHLCVLHRCDNRQCVRPDHLFLGTRADNNSDRDKKGRYRKGRVDYGEAHAGTKFSTADIEAMRVLAASGKFQQRYIANLFKASEAQVHRIVHGKIRIQG